MRHRQRQTALDVFDVCTAAENNFDVRPRSLQIGNHLVVERLVLVVNFDGVCADLERIGCRRNELCLIVAAVTQEVIACDLGDELDGLGVDSSSVVHDLVGVAHDVAERRAGTADQRRAAGVVRAAGLCSCQRRGDAVPHDLYADLEVGADYAADLLSHNRHAATRT